MCGKLLSAFERAGGDAHIAHSQALHESLYMRHALHTCSDDQQRACHVGRKMLRGEQRNGSRAACGDGWAIEHGNALGHLGAALAQHAGDLLRECDVRQASCSLISIQDHF